MEISSMLFFVLFLTFVELKSVRGDDSREDSHALNFYSFPVMDIGENIISLEDYKGKVSLIVNVASRCGYTDNHYRMLDELQQQFRDSEKFTVLAFPCNQFGGQEPGSHKEIFNFAYRKMKVSFPLFAKVNVINQDANAAWQYLIDKSGLKPTWNFWKYLVDHEGRMINAWGPNVSPDKLYPHIESAVNKAKRADSNRLEKESEDNKKESSHFETSSEDSKTKTNKIKKQSKAIKINNADIKGNTVRSNSAKADDVKEEL